jgi:ferritin-like metal-binding protein YciE
MAELQEREAKLVQYLNEAYAKEQELVTALQAHISLTTRDSYKKRLKDHLKETKAQAKGLERRVKQLGGKVEKVDLPGPDAVSQAAGRAQSAAQKAMAMAKGPMHALRGTGEAEKMLKNAKTEFWNEAEEIANYHAIESLAEAVGDRDTVKLAREFRRQEERMAKFLEKLIGQLTKEVVRDEIPASQRNGGTRRRASSRKAASRSSSSRARTAAPRSASSRATSSRATSSRATSSRASSSRGTSARAKAARSSATSRAKSARSAASNGSSRSTKAKGASGGRASASRAKAKRS